jgi:hypothetical protein
MAKENNKQQHVEPRPSQEHDGDHSTTKQTSDDEKDDDDKSNDDQTTTKTQWRTNEGNE